VTGPPTDPYRHLARYYDLVLSPMMRYRQLAVRELGVTRGSTVLDIGCGTGLSFAALEDVVGPQGRIIGVEPSHDMRLRAGERARANGWTNVELVESGAEDLQPATPADGALLFLTHDVLRSRQAMDAVLRAVRPGGRIVALGAQAPAHAPRVKRLVVRLLTRRFVRSLDQLDKPWRRLEQAVGEVKVRSLLAGGAFLLVVEVPALSRLSD